MKPRIISGVGTSGNIHIGNYLGALKQWVDLQNEYETFFFLADHHAITVKQDPTVLHEKITEIAKLYWACGIDPEKSTVFIQSHVPAHTQLAWILSTLTKTSEMEKMTQFKDKSKKNAENINIGLMTYPILMAADILLYNTNLVPVGEDQTQHLEFARTIARRFNKRYEQIFTIPEQFTPPQGARIMSLKNPSDKMSKSDKSSNSRIELLDSPDLIKSKIRKAVTDSGDEIVYSEDKPALKNLLEIYSSFSGQTIPEIVNHYQGTSYKLFKEGLAKVIIEGLRPIQQKYHAYDKDPELVQALLTSGAEKANLLANSTLRRVQQAIGYRV
jgi:tryptophanyl-tRNA synthetase